MLNHGETTSNCRVNGTSILSGEQARVVFLRNTERFVGDRTLTSNYRVSNYQQSTNFV